jgi:predicted TIM-barrel fold metal-dependent hydrolase
MTEPLDTPVIDAHHHFWDPVAHYYPWLCDADRPPHRYGDQAAICRPYLPADYRRDTAAFELAGSVYVEAEWDPKDPIGEMRYIESLRKQSGLPSVAVGQAWLDQPEVDGTLEQLAAFGFVRGIRHKPRANASPRDAQPGGMMDGAWREGYALLARHGLHFELQTPWWHLHEAQVLARDFPGTPIVINHAGMPSDRSVQGMAGWRQAMRGARRDRALRHRPVHVRQQLPGRQPVRFLRGHFRRLRGHRGRADGARPAQAVPRQRAAAVPHSALVSARSGAPGCCRAAPAGTPLPPATTPSSCA